MKTLTLKQQRFCEEYLIDLNATQAAIRAGYSERTARSQGQRLLTYVDIAAVIEKGRVELSERTGFSAQQTVNAIGRIAYDTEVHVGYRLKALELLGKHFGIFVTKSEVRHSGSISDGDPGLQATMDLVRAISAESDEEDPLRD
jgi:phage terminase small subunit